MASVKEIDFQPHPLSDKVWDNKILRPAVREQMLKAAREFIDEFEIDMSVVKDITFTGSMAGFYWLDSSDVDLHIIVSFDEMKDRGDHDILREYFDLAKVVWGKNREQFICGHEVELYVQDIGQPHYASGVYSALNDEWLSVPEKFGDVDIDVRYIEYRLSHLRRQIAHASDLVTRDPKKAMEYIDRLKDKMGKMRKDGLEEDGEMSPDNLAFKTMRREGLLEQLRELYKTAYTNYTSLNCDVE
jgi:hypothetical protein